MAFAIRASSDGRPWTGFDATLYETSGGTVSCPGLPVHNFSMHVGAPIKAARRCEGPTHHRLQTPGDIDLIPVGSPAFWEDNAPTSFLRINLSPMLIRSTAESMGLNADSLSLAPLMQIRDPILQHIAWALKAAVESGEPHDRLFAESLGTSLAARLLRRYATSAKVGRGLTRRQWQLIVDYINSNLTMNLSLAELAGVLGLSASTFKVLFKQSVGMPVHKYVVRRRVEHAMSLLSSSRPNFNEVAMRAGFVDQSHMARCFRRVLGVTPADVAREYR